MLDGVECRKDEGAKGLRQANALLEQERLQLAADRAQLARLLERLPEAVITCGSDGVVEFVNAGAIELLGARPGARLPRDWHGIDLDDVVHDLVDAHAEPVELVADDDEGRVCRVVGVPAAPPEGPMLVIIDVSARARLERAQREFVTNAAHELLTPLTAIASAIEVLLNGAKDSPEERDLFLSHIDTQTHRLTRLTRALLVLARAQTQQESPRAEVVPLEPLLREVADGTVVAGTVALEIDCPTELAALANRDLVEQVLANLLTNAARYTERGVIEVTARANEGSVVVAISDTGRGMPRGVQDRVTERFYRIDEEDGAGFGLGLAIVKQALDAVGGRLEIDSTPGRGTTVRVTLPAAELMQA